MRSRTQHAGRVSVAFDGDGSAWIWTPNVDDPDRRLELDLTGDAAELADIGLRSARAPEASRHDRGGLAVLVEVDLGAAGTAAVDGEPCSSAALATLIARGWLTAVRAGMEHDLGDAGPVPRGATESDVPSNG